MCKPDSTTKGLKAVATPSKGSQVTGKANTTINTKVCSCKVSTFASNSRQLVDLIKQAEEMLIKNGMNNIEDRICTLRGIYYGTTWSMDYDKEKSDIRNRGFRLYTQSSPQDARPLLKCCDRCKSNLFESLKKSPEINIGTNKAFDWGHAIIGLDCRRSFIARNPTPIALFTGGTGLEVCTWLGDIGGGTGMLSYRRTSNRTIRAKTVVFDSVHDYGCTANLEGDIGGYLIGRENNDSVTSFNNKNKYLYEILDKYLISDANEWKDRGKIFLKTIGGKFNTTGNDLTNKDDLIKKIGGKVAEFADLYILMRSRDKKYSNESLKESSRHFYGAANEVASMFIDAILNIVKTPNAKLVAITNPNPTVPGEAWKKYQTASNIQKAIKTIDDAIK